MRGAVMYGPGDVRVEERDEPQIVEPTDAIIRLSATCVCGSDLWPYRGIEPSRRADADGARVRRRSSRRSAREVSTIKPSATSSSGRSGPRTTRARSAGPATRARACTASSWAPIGTQAELAARPARGRHPRRHAGHPDDDLIPSLLAASDVLGTGWFAAVAAEAGPARRWPSSATARSGCIGVLAAKQLGAERIIAMSRHEARQRLAREFGATDIVEERGDAGVARIKELTDGLGAHSVDRGRRHAGVDDAGDPLHPPRRARRLRRRRARRRSSPAMELFLAASTSTAARPRCAASCPS